MKKGVVFFKYASVLGLSSFAVYLWQRFVLKRPFLKIKMAGLPHVVSLRNEPSDIAMFTNIFVHEEYGITMAHPVHTMIDCGANIGLASLYFLKKFPAVNIICLEPEPGNFSILEQNLGWNKNVQLIQKAVWHSTTNLQLTGQERGNAGFTVTEEAAASAATVPAVALQDIVNDGNWEGIDICKMDVEGSEEAIFLKGETAWLQQVKTMFIEIHENIKPGLTSKLLALLSPSFTVRQHGEYHVFNRIP